MLYRNQSGGNGLVVGCKYKDAQHDAIDIRTYKPQTLNLIIISGYSRYQAPVHVSSVYCFDNTGTSLLL